MQFLTKRAKERNLKRAEAVRAWMTVTTEPKAVRAGKSGDDGRACAMTPN